MTNDRLMTLYGAYTILVVLGLSIAMVVLAVWVRF